MTTLLDLDTHRNYYVSESGYSSASSPSSVVSSDSSCQGLDLHHMNLSDSIDFSMEYARQYIYTDIPLQSTAQLVIIEQPVEKFRFRYKSEMHGTHGSLMGIQTEKSKKTFPTVELRGYNARAVIRCRLYQVEVPQPHSHRLVVRKGDEDINDPHDVSVSPEDGFRAVFQGMGIIHTAKKHIVEELIVKKEREKKFELGRQLTTREISQIKLNAEKEAKAMNLNQVCLGFQAFGIQNDGSWVKICEPVFSKPINNMKSALTGELKISRMSASTSSAAGHEDLFLFVEKVGKKNIKVRFFELDKYDEEVWEGWGSFCEADVHHQYAIALYTPPYKNVDIEKSVDVFIQLVRPSDDDRSPPLPFKYKPKDCVISRKRARMSSSTYSSSELPVSVVMASSGAGSISDGKTISEEYNKEQILDTFLKSLTSLNSADLINMAEPLVDAEETDSVGPTKPSVIQRTPCAVKEEKAGLDRLYQIMRTSGASPDVNLVKKILIEENLLQNAIGTNNSTAIRKLLTIIHKLELSDVLQSQNERRETCLHYACSLDLAEYIRPLINLGADPNIGDIHGNTPLHIAVEENHTLCVSKIIDQSSYTAKSKPLQIDLANHEGLTPLHVAARNKNLALVRKLLEVGKASTKIAIAKNGNNVLHIAVEENDKDMVKYLVENTSVNINEPNTCGHTPLQLAYGVGGISKEIIEVLSKNSAQSELSRNPAQPAMDMDESSSTDDEDEDKALKIYEENDQTLSEECLDELSTILNKSGKWKNLAKLLDMNSTIIKLCEQDSNPSKAMLRFINDDNLPLEDILKAMKNLNMKDAIIVISNSKNDTH